MAKQTLEQWWEEDAERVNQLADFARKNKKVIQVGKIKKKLKELFKLIKNPGKEL